VARGLQPAKRTVTRQRLANAEHSPSEVSAPVDNGEGAAGPFGGAVLPLREVQRRYARWAVAQSGGVKAHAARALGVDIKTLMKLLRE
jgi:DNA-binding NtrC family response regulator